MELSQSSFFLSENRYSYIYFSWPGRAHDARVYAQSPLAEELSDLCHVENRRIDETFHIIGDSAYPLSNHLITPYRVRKQNMTLDQKKFNTHLASKRSVIERAFGLLGLRFPRLLKLKVQSLEKHISCIVVACVLHNWCIMEDDGEDFDEMEGDNLDVSVGENIAADAYLGQRRAVGGCHQKTPPVSVHFRATLMNFCTI